MRVLHTFFENDRLPAAFGVDHLGLGFEFSFETPFWTCPVGSTGVTTPPMLHVWIIDNGKEGPFAADLDKTVQKTLQGS